MKSSLTASRVQPWQHGAREKTGVREEGVGLVQVFVDEHVFPWYQGLVETPG